MSRNPKNEEATAARWTPWHVTIGTGPPILVLGGIHMSHSYMRPWLDPLAGTHQLTYMDHRGAGKSPQSDLTHVTHQTWVSDIENLRRKLGVERVTLLAHSYGGFLALEYAPAYPGALHRLVLCSTASALNYMDVSLALAQKRGTPEQLQLLLQGFSAPIADDEALRQTLLAVNPVYFAGDYEPFHSHFANAVSYHAGSFNQAHFSCLPGYNVTSRLGELHIRTLIITGRHDWITPVTPAAERLAAGIPDATLRVFEQSGHYPFMEEQERFTDLVGQWLGEQHTR
jgi:proline iminopeptidase